MPTERRTNHTNDCTTVLVLSLSTSIRSNYSWCSSFLHHVFCVIAVMCGDAPATFQRPDFLCDMIIFRRASSGRSCSQACLCRHVFTDSGVVTLSYISVSVGYCHSVSACAQRNNQPFQANRLLREPTETALRTVRMQFIVVFCSSIWINSDCFATHRAGNT